MGNTWARRQNCRPIPQLLDQSYASLVLLKKDKGVYALTLIIMIFTFGAYVYNWIMDDDALQHYPGR